MCIPRCVVTQRKTTFTQFWVIYPGLGSTGLEGLMRFTEDFTANWDLRVRPRQWPLRLQPVHGDVNGQDKRKTVPLPNQHHADVSASGTTATCAVDPNLDKDEWLVSCASHFNVTRRDSDTISTASQLPSRTRTNTTVKKWILAAHRKQIPITQTKTSQY
jgi:hypothetical protein